MPAAGLRIVEMIPVATLPLSDKRLLLPVGLAEPLERMMSRWSVLTGVAQDILYACAPRKPAATTRGARRRAQGV